MIDAIYASPIDHRRLVTFANPFLSAMRSATTQRGAPSRSDDGMTQTWKYVLAAALMCVLCGCDRKATPTSTQADSAQQKKLIARIHPSGFALAHDTFNGIGAGSDGKIYFVLSSESYETGAQAYSFDPSTSQVKHLGDLTEACGEKGMKAIVQGKSHVSFVESNGKLYFATHVGYYSVIDGMEKMGVPPPGFHPYPGGHILSLDMRSGKFDDLGKVATGEGIITMSMDVRRGQIFGLTWPTGNFFRFDVAKREFKEFGPFFEKGENGQGSSYRTICRSIAVQPNDGTAWFTRGEGTIFRYDPKSDSVAPFSGENLKRDYFGQYDFTSGGHMAYNWRRITWIAARNAFYGVHGNSGYLFRFDPAAPVVDVLDRITSEPSRRSGMFDQFSYGYLGFDLGPDGHTLYYLTGGPVYAGGKRVTGKNSTAKGEAMGTENLHLVTYETEGGHYIDHGPVFYENGDRPTYVNSIAVGKDGSVYAIARVKSGEGHAELISIKP